MNRKRYRELYRVYKQIDPATGKEKMQVRYVGGHFVLPASAPPKGRVLLICGLALLAHVAAFLAAGLLNNAGSRCFYVLPFFLFQFMPAVYGIRGLITFWQAPARMTELQKEESVERMLHSGYGIAVLGALCVVSDAAFMLSGGAANAVGLEVCFCLLNVAMTVAGILLAKIARKAVPVQEKVQESEAMPQPFA